MITRINARTGRVTTDPVDAPSRPPGAGDVIRERDRRITAGTTLAITGIGDMRLTGDDRTINRITAMYAAAQDMLTNEIPGTQRFTDADGVGHALTPSQVIEMARKGYAWVEARHAFADAMLRDPPADYVDDRHWSD